jgi:hypothetical protein
MKGITIDTIVKETQFNTIVTVNNVLILEYLCSALISMVIIMQNTMMAVIILGISEINCNETMVAIKNTKKTIKFVNRNFLSIPFVFKMNGIITSSKLITNKA